MVWRDDGERRPSKHVTDPQGDSWRNDVGRVQLVQVRFTVSVNGFKRSDQAWLVGAILVFEATVHATPKAVRTTQGATGATAIQSQGRACVMYSTS